MDLKKLKKTDLTSKANEKLVKSVLTFWSVVAVLFALFFWFQRYNTLSLLNVRSNTLNSLTHYDTLQISKAKQTKDLFPKRKTLQDIIKTNEDLEQELNRYKNYMKELQAPYFNFLQYIYLPRLNIWKNVYTNAIDTSIIWQKFLEKNKFDKLALIVNRSNFFKDVWDTTQFNEITDIQIWDIKEEKDWFFYIPISLAFTSPSKRSFLLLMEKLSTTSNKDNITLINEFLYHIWENIKKQKKSIIENTIYPWSLKNDKDVDKKIWYLFYHRVFDPNFDKQDLIDQNIIEDAIAESANCKQPKTNKCYYLFRDKFRNIPYLAYSIAWWWIDKVSNLKLFLQELPPIIKIKEFTFDQSRKAKFGKQTNKYEWKISIEVVGKWITDDEIKEIAKVLWKTCFDNNLEMSVDNWIKQIDAYSAELANIAIDNVSKWQNLAKLKEIFENLKKEYPKLSNYKKTIKLFEMYRMLKDANVCKL